MGYPSQGVSSLTTIERHNPEVTTDTDYADILKINKSGVEQLIITLIETGTSESFNYKILGSIKEGNTQPENTDASYQELRGETLVAAGGAVYEVVTAPWKWIIVQVKNGSGSATVTARARGV